jgi:uncharacterized RDD family membrane protein YckC
MAEWIPFERSALSDTGSAAVPPMLIHTCTECGKDFPEGEMLQYENAWVCAACKPVFFQRIKEGVATKGSLRYASIGSRFLAILIDGFIMVFAMGIVIFVPFLLVASWVVSPGKTVGDQSWVMVLMMILVYGLPPLYEIIFIGKYGATPGKMAMKIKVVRPDGGRISYARSTGRYFAKILSGMILYIGYLMAFWDDEKCALHDRICQTRVVKVDPS